MNTKIKLVNVQKMLKEERAKSFLTYQDVANALGCSASYIFRIEKGRRKKPSYEIVSKLINFFELTDHDLIKYIDHDVKVEEKESILLEGEITQFVKSMNVNSLTDVNELISKVKTLQEVIKDKEIQTS